MREPQRGCNKNDDDKLLIVLNCEKGRLMRIKREVSQWLK